MSEKKVYIHDDEVDLAFIEVTGYFEPGTIVGRGGNQKVPAKENGQEDSFVTPKYEPIVSEEQLAACQNVAVVAETIEPYKVNAKQTFPGASKLIVTGNVKAKRVKWPNSKLRTAIEKRLEGKIAFCA